MQTQTASEPSNAKRRARCPKIELPLMERAAVTPNEFAALFGKETTWGYRQIYAGKVSVIKSLGHQMIPRSEIQRLMGTAAPLIA
jgi:hypothetical protein